MDARREERLSALTDKIKLDGGHAVYKKTDVASLSEVKALAKFALDQYGQIDVWINMRVSCLHSAFDQLRVNDWERMIDVNMKGVLYGIAAALRSMLEKKNGHFINISTVAGGLPVFYVPAAKYVSCVPSHHRGVRISIHKEDITRSCLASVV